MFRSRSSPGLPDSTHKVEWNKNELIGRAVDSKQALIERALVKTLDKRLTLINTVLSSSEGQDRVMKWSMGASVVIVESLKPLISQWKNSGRRSYQRASALLLDLSTRLMSLIMRLITTETSVSVTNALALGRMVGLFVYFSGNALQWTVKTGLVYAPIRPFKVLALCGVLFSTFVSVLLDSDRLLRAQAKFRMDKRVIGALNESLACIKRTKKQFSDEADFNAMMGLIRQDPSHPAYPLTRRLNLAAAPEDFKGAQVVSENVLASSVGTGSSAGWGLKARQTFLWRLDVLVGQLKTRRAATEKKMGDDASLMGTIKTTIIKGMIDAFCALNFVRGWNAPAILTALLEALSASIGMVRLLKREVTKLRKEDETRARLKELEGSK